MVCSRAIMGHKFATEFQQEPAPVITLPEQEGCPEWFVPYMYDMVGGKYVRTLKIHPLKIKDAHPNTHTHTWTNVTKHVSTSNSFSKQILILRCTTCDTGIELFHTSFSKGEKVQYRFCYIMPPIHDPHSTRYWGGVCTYGGNKNDGIKMANIPHIPTCSEVMKVITMKKALE